LYYWYKYTCFCWLPVGWAKQQILIGSGWVFLWTNGNLIL
jgi:hypothetical protein